MQNKFSITFKIIIIIAIFHFNFLNATNYYWTNSNSNNWEDSLNWVDALGVSLSSLPGQTDSVFFTNSNNSDCYINSNVEIGGLFIDGYTGTIYINSGTINILNGNCTFNTGTINGDTLTINTSGNVIFAGTTFNIVINSVSGRLNLNGSVFNDDTYLEKNGSGDDNSSGSNIFNSNTYITNSGEGYLCLQNEYPDTFATDVTIKNTGTSYIIFADNSTGTTTVNGNITFTNSGDNSFIKTCTQPTSTLHIKGTCIINNTGSGNSSNNYFALNGTTNIDGNLILNNNSNAYNSYIYLSYYTGAQLNISGATTIYNEGDSTTSCIYLGYDANITFNDTVFVHNNSSASISDVYFAYNSSANVLFNQNIILESTDVNCDGVSFGENGGTTNLANGKTITIGDSGFVSGRLLFENFTQTGSTPQTLICSGTAILENKNSYWGGNVYFSAPSILTQLTTYKGTTILKKTGTSNDYSIGGNKFYQETELIKTGTGSFLMSGVLSGAIADTCFSNLTLTNTASTGLLAFAAYSANNYIAGNLKVENNASCDICRNSGASVIIEGNTVLNHKQTSATNAYIGFGFYGYLTCNGSVTANNTGNGVNNKIIYLGEHGSIVFNAPVYLKNNASALTAQIRLNYRSDSHNQYNDSITIESYGNSDGVFFGDYGGTGILASGKTVTIGDSGFVSGRLLFENFTQTGSTPQTLQCSGTAILENKNSYWGGNVYFSAPSILTQLTTYKGTTILKKTGTSNDYSIGGNKFYQETELIKTGTGRFFMSGVLSGAIADTCFSNLTLTNPASTGLLAFAAYSANNYIAGNLTVNNNASCDICRNSGASVTIEGNTILNHKQTSATNAYIGFGFYGHLTCNGSVTANNTGNGVNNKIIYLGEHGSIVFNAPVYLKNNASSVTALIRLNHKSESHNSYNDSIVIESYGNSDGVIFGDYGGIGTLASGKTITIGDSGFVSGKLLFENFTQTGSTPQTLICSGTTILENKNSYWGGNVYFSAPSILTQGTLYEGTAFLEKTSLGDDKSGGLNTFKKDAIIKNSGTGKLYLAYLDSNTYYGNISYLASTGNVLYPAYNGASVYFKNININSGGDMYFAQYSNGKVIFKGSIPQSINNTGNTEHYFEIAYLQTNNTSGDITLNTNIHIRKALDLINGNIISSDTCLLIMEDNSSVVNVSDSAFVQGPVEKTGNDAFTFPVGDSAMYRPAAISAPANTSAKFRCEYHKENPWLYWSGGSGTRDETIDHISSREYWILNRTYGNDNVYVTLSWRQPASAGVSVLSDLLVARWDGTKWKDHGNGGTTGDTNSGTIISSNEITSFSPFTLASSSNLNPLPVNFLDLSLTKLSNTIQVNWTTLSEINNNFFEVQKSKDAINFNTIAVVNAATNSNTKNNYSVLDYKPVNGLNYYRIKQVDFDGNYSYSKIKSFYWNKNLNKNINIYPNPVHINSSLNIKFDVNKNENYKLVILNAIGENIFSDIIQTNEKTNIELSINTNGYKPGIYILKLMSNNEVIVNKKLIIYD